MVKFVAYGSDGWRRRASGLEVDSLLPGHSQRDHQVVPSAGYYRDTRRAGRPQRRHEQEQESQVAQTVGTRRAIGYWLYLLGVVTRAGVGELGVSLAGGLRRALGMLPAHGA